MKVKDIFDAEAQRSQSNAERVKDKVKGVTQSGIRSKEAKKGKGQSLG